MKVPAIISDAKAALEEGFSVVIGLQSTGEVWKNRQYPKYNECVLISCS